MIEVNINGKIFYKSSLSAKSYKCVGIRRQDEEIHIINTKTDGPSVKFTLDEWQTFVDGIKSGEFDSLLRRNHD
jgi:hypothetical protein